MTLNKPGSNIGSSSRIFLNKQEKPDIYLYNENLPFKERHPIFRTLMKLEFEDVIRSFPKRTPEKYQK